MYIYNIFDLYISNISSSRNDRLVDGWDAVDVLHREDILATTPPPSPSLSSLSLPLSQRTGLEFSEAYQQHCLKCMYRDAPTVSEDQVVDRIILASMGVPSTLFSVSPDKVWTYIQYIYK